jgi:hypothetical protein
MGGGLKEDPTGASTFTPAHINARLLITRMICLMVEEIRLV